MFDEIESRGIIEPELEDGEPLLWVGKPSPGRMLIPSIILFVFGVVWSSSIVGFIYTWHSVGPRVGNGPGGVFGTLGLLSNLFFAPFVLIGLGMLSSPIWVYRKAKQTVYGITRDRILIVQNGRVRRVRTYSPSDINAIERTERADGSGDLTFARRSYRDSDGDRRSETIQFVGIPEVRSVEKLLRDLFANKPDPA